MKDTVSVVYDILIDEFNVNKENKARKSYFRDLAYIIVDAVEDQQKEEFEDRKDRER